MQHLDEGTIHSWLDGALSADESARVETHVKECPQCAAAVAEARGFIAGSSRILTALDHAPRGVVPIAAPRRRVDPVIWRVAATVLVIAGGTLVVVKNRGANETQTSTLADRAAALPQSTSATEQASGLGEQSGAPAAPSANSAVRNAPTIALSKKARDEIPQSGRSAGKSKAVAQGAAAQAGQTAGAAKIAGAAAAPVAAPTSPTFAPARVGSVAAMDAAAVEPLRVVGSPRQIGAKVTLYEVATGDTVTLTESVSVRLEQAVVTAAPMTRRATEKSAAAPAKARADAAIAAAPDSQRAPTRALSTLAAPAPAPSRQQESNAVHTIVWTDPATGNTLSLTGRLPEARLQEIRLRIERERAAAANKNR